MKSEGDLQKLRKEIEKEYGEGSLQGLEDKAMDIEAISTGSFKLDMALGIGGLPRGRVIEIYGPESSGKTTIAAHVIAEANAKGERCAFIDAEHAFDKNYAKAIGVITDLVDISQPDYGEQALDIAIRLANSGLYSVIVIDSVAALVPKSEIEGEMEDSSIGVQARMMSKALRKITAAANNSGTMIIFINQLREKIGVMFGSPEVTTGGNALKFYASVRLDIRRSISATNLKKEGEEAIGNKTTVKVIKNKVAPPFKTVTFDILYGVGIDKMGEMIDVAIELGIIHKGGAWFTYKEIKHQGMDNLMSFLLDNPELIEELREQVINHFKK